MNRVVFLDRDGVINKKGASYYIFREDDFELNEGVTDALKYFQEAQSQDPFDPVFSMFISRCQRYRDNPPPPDWKGFEKLDHK